MKQIFAIGILVLATTLLVFSQNRIGLQIEASPNYSFKTFKNNSVFNITSNAKSKIGYSISIKSSFRLFNEFHVITGIELNNKGFKTKVFDWHEEYNYIIKDGIIEMFFLEIPLYCKYKIKLDELFNFSPIVGLSYGRLIGLRVLYDGKKKSARNIVTLHCS